MCAVGVAIAFSLSTTWKTRGTRRVDDISAKFPVSVSVAAAAASPEAFSVSTSSVAGVACQGTVSPSPLTPGGKADGGKPVGKPVGAGGFKAGRGGIHPSYDTKKRRLSMQLIHEARLISSYPQPRPQCMK